MNLERFGKIRSWVYLDLRLWLNFWLNFGLKLLGFLGLSAHFVFPQHSFAQVNRSPAIIDSETRVYVPTTNSTDTASTAIRGPATLPASEAPIDANVPPEVANIIAANGREANTAVPGSDQAKLKQFSARMYGPDGKSGFLKTIGQRFLQAEATHNSAIRPHLTNPEVLAELDHAIALRNEVETKLFSKNYSKEAKLGLLQMFIGNVLLPLRELLVMSFTKDDLEAYLKRINEGRKKRGLPPLAVFDPIEVYLPHIPQELAPKDSVTENLIANGPDPLSRRGMRVDDLGSRDDQNNNCRAQRRLEFDYDPVVTLSRDIRALSNAVTKENYLRGIKLMTLQMIIQQLNFHNTILGITEPIRIPEGCRKADAGLLPEKVDAIKVDEAARQGALDILLKNNGFIAGLPEFNEFYLGNVISSPDSSGFSGYIPFEKLRSAQRGLDPKRPVTALPEPNPASGTERSRHVRDYMEPAIDDQTDFEHVFSIKSNQAIHVVPERMQTGLKPLVEPFLTPAPSNLVLKEGESGLPVLGWSSYIVNKMKTAGTYDWCDKRVVCPKALAILQNNIVRLPMPRLDGPDPARRFGLAQLWKFAERYKKETSESFLSAVRVAVCNNNPSAPPFCKQGDGPSVKAWLAEVASILKIYANPDEYLPNSAIEDQNVRKYYGSLVRLWDAMRDTQTDNPSRIPDASPTFCEKRFAPTPGAPVFREPDVKLSSIMPDAVQTELSYIGSHLDSTPWASYRLAYVVAQNCGDAARIPEGPRGLEIVGQTMGLNTILSPDHGNRILNSDEKKAIWQTTVDEYARRSTFLFNAKVEHFKGDTFDRLERVQRSKPIFSAEDAKRTAKTNLGFVSPQVSASIDKIASQPDSAAGTYLSQIYQLKGHPEEQKKLLEEMSVKFQGLDSADNAKLRLLAVDTDFKRPIYYQVLKDAATKRRGQLRESLESLCSLDPENNVKEFKQLVRSTVKSQDQLNQVLGLPEAPASVKKELDRWADEDKANMKLTGLQMAFFIGAAVMAAGCVAGSGGICAPVAAAVLSAAATGTQLYIFKNSLSAAVEADEKERYTRVWKDLGFTTEQAVTDSREGHSYLMASVDAAFTLPLLGATAKSVQMGSRSVIESGPQMAARLRGLLGKEAVENLESANTATRAGRRVLQGVAHETEVKASLYTLNIESVANDLRQFGVHALPALKRELVDPASVERLTQSDVVSAFAKTLSKQYGNSPASLRRFFESYTGSRLAALEQKLAGLEANYLERNPGLIRQLFMDSGIPLNRLDKISNQVLHLRKMSALVKELRALEASGGNLEEFIAKNQDEIREILMNLPMRKREIPYHVLMQGSPFSFSGIPGIKQTLGVIDDALVARKIAVAAENLMFEVARKEAYKKLGLKPQVAIHSTYEMMADFVGLIERELAKEGDPQLLAKYVQFQRNVAERVRLVLMEKNAQTPASVEDVMRYLFKPADLQERVMGRELWNSTPTKDLFKAGELEGPADQLVRKLSNYENTDQFENYLTALKVLTISKRPTVITN